jgi:hypothetical protein
MSLSTLFYQDPRVRSKLYVNGASIVFPAGSDRKTTETLSKIPNGKLRRTINRKAIFIRNTTQGNGVTRALSRVTPEFRRPPVTYPKK